MIRISPDAGRIGPLWWFNSNLQPCDLPVCTTETGQLRNLRTIRWGTCGLGLNVRIEMEPLPDDTFSIGEMEVITALLRREVAP